MRHPGPGRAIAAVIFCAAIGCRRASPPPSPPVAPPTSAALELPDVPGFAAGPPAPGDGFVRRTYTRGAARVQVTLARMPMSADDFQRWRADSAAFPQADLGLPADRANGFYQCADGPAPSCDLLIQLRAGFHLEIRSGGTASRADVDALARGLPLAAWAAAP
ncbi:MAG TPA: hypothetical protein VN962_11400 [Polyangia bacterium]|nr:hypothetical protein [Polyangia bacterium]